MAWFVSHGRPLQSFVHAHSATRTLRESQLQRTGELDESEGLEQIHREARLVSTFS
jgi:hypothetical protein